MGEGGGGGGDGQAAKSHVSPLSQHARRFTAVFVEAVTEKQKSVPASPTITVGNECFTRWRPGAVEVKPAGFSGRGVYLMA